MSLSRLICCLLPLLLQSPAIVAQPSNASITGVVTDANGQPLPGISIYLENTTQGMATDAEGRYLLTNLRPGQYILVARGVGYKTAKQPILLERDQSLTYNFTLAEDAFELLEVHISEKSEAQKLRETAYTVDVLQTKKYKNLTTDINQVLKTTPGIHIREAGGLGSGFSLSLNGLSGNQVRYFIDGVPMENFGSALTLNNFPVNLIENIEVYKGVVPISLGADALGGAINITTAYRKKSFLDAAYSYGSFNTHRASLNGQYASKKKGYFLKLTSFFNHSDNNYRMHDVPLYDPNGNLEDYISPRRFHDQYTSAMAKVEAGLFDKKMADRLSVGLTYAINNKNYQHPDNNIKRVYGKFHTENKTLLLSSNYEKSWDKLHLRGYFLAGEITGTTVDTSTFTYNWAGAREQRKPDDPKGELNNRRSLLELRDKVFRSNIQARYNITSNHSLATSFSQNTLSRIGEDKVDLFNRSFESANSVNKNILGLAYNYLSKSKKWEATAFAKNYWFTGQIVTYDVEDQRKEYTMNNSHPGYGLATTYHFNDEVQVKTSFERAHRLPESFEILGDGIYINPNPGLQPEKSYNANLGLAYGSSYSRLSFHTEANFFVRHSRNFIRFVPRGPFGQYENLSNVSTKGFEAGLTLKYSQRVNFSTNFTYQNITDQNQYDEGQVNVHYKNKLPNLPYFFANARLSIHPFRELKQGDFTVHWNTRYVHEFFLTWEELGTVGEKNIIPSQLTHDLELEYALANGRYNLSLTASNITNARVYDNFLIQKAGRAFYIKIRYLLK